MRSLLGIPVTSCTDLQNGWKDLPRSNVILYDFSDGTRLILRPSGTEPKMKAYCFVNAADQATAEKKLADFTSAVSELLKNN